jgi:hypothetical protein
MPSPAASARPNFETRTPEPSDPSSIPREADHDDPTRPLPTDAPPPPPDQRRTPGQILIVGQKRSGKTTLLSSLLEQASRSRVMVADPHREHGARAVEVSSAEDVEAYLDRANGRWRFAYWSPRLSVMERKGALPEFAYICRLARNLGDCLFVGEEIHWYCTAYQIPVEFELLIKNAGHYRVEIWCTTQRPQDVHGLVKSECDGVYILGLSDVGALDWVRRFDARVTPEQVQRLRQGQACYLDMGSGRTAPAVFLDTRTLKEIRPPM